MTYLSTKMEPLRLYLSTCDKAGFNGVQLQHVLLFWHLNLEMEGTVSVHHFPDRLHHKIKKYLKCPDGTELLKHSEMTLQLCQIQFCALKRPRQAFQVTK